MSHARGRHDSCRLRLLNPWPHSTLLSLARGMTDVGVGSGALFGFFSHDANALQINNASTAQNAKSDPHIIIFAFQEVVARQSVHAK